MRRSLAGAGGGTPARRARRAALLAVAVIGAAVAAFPVVTGQPAKAQAAYGLFQAMRPQTTVAAVDESRLDLATMRVMATGMTQTALPLIASRLHESPAQFGGEMAARYPATARAMLEMGSMLDFFGAYQGTFEREAPLVRSIGDSPVPPWLVPVVLGVVPGLAVTVLAVTALRRPRATRRAAIAIAGVGGLLAATLLATGLYGQERNGDELTSAFSPVFSPAGLDRADAYAATLRTMSAELQQRVFPDFAGRLNTTPAGLVASLLAQSPELASGLAQLPRLVDRLVAATADNRAHASDFQAAASIPWAGGAKTTAYWLTMVPALLLVALGGGVLATARRRGAVAPAT